MQQRIWVLNLRSSSTVTIFLAAICFRQTTTTTTSDNANKTSPVHMLVQPPPHPAHTTVSTSTSILKFSASSSTVMIFWLSFFGKREREARNDNRQNETKLQIANEKRLLTHNENNRQRRRTANAISASYFSCTNNSSVTKHRTCNTARTKYAALLEPNTQHC